MSQSGGQMPGQNTPVDDGKMELQRDIRSAAAIAYELRRHEQIQQRVWIADALNDLEQELLRIEAKLGGPQRDNVGPIALRPALDILSGKAHDAGPVVAAQIGALIGSVRGLELQLEQSTQTDYLPVQQPGAAPTRRAG
jgi:hypothetical protein